MTEFNPQKLTTPPPRVNKPKQKSERVFINVTSYETPADGFHFAVGERLDRPGQQVRVRLTTVAERAEDAPNLDRAKIEQLYATGSKTRDSIADKSKNGIKLMAFDDARFIGTSGDEKLPTFRAHWPNAMAAAESNAEVFIGYGAIKLDDEDPAKGKKATAQVDFIKSATVITAENAGQVLSDAFAIKDDNGNARKPFVVIRANFEGANYANPRIYPAQVEGSVFDQALGRDKPIVKTADAQATLDELMSGKPYANEIKNKSADFARAMIAGIFQMDMPVVNAADTEKCEQLYLGAKQGKLQIEVLACETMYFGKDSGLTYVAKKDQPHFAAYRVPVSTSKGETIQDGFTKTVVAFQRHPDGEPYVVYASPLAMRPYARVLSELKIDQLNNTASLDATAEAEVPAPAQPVAAESVVPVAAAATVAVVAEAAEAAQEAVPAEPELDDDNDFMP